jgi:hypothetical protein
VKSRLVNQPIGFASHPFPRGLEFMATLMLGSLAFIFVCGWKILDPTNLSFLQSGDPAQHYLGWAFYRLSSFNFPLGLNPLYGLEISSSIVFSDSIPLIAIPLRFFNNYLPQPFQYFGIYILAIFLLQGYFSWKLTGLIVRGGDFQCAVIRLLVTGLFLFSPPLIWRLSQHTALASHFLILAAIYLALKPFPEYSFSKWLVLLTLAALIHFYIFFMVALIFLATLLDRQSSQFSLHWKFLFRDVFVMVLVLGILLWQAGYFVGTSVLNTKWYGLGNLNLLALFDSNGWSSVLPDIPQTMGSLDSKYLPGRVFDGFNYFGLGYLFLCLLAVPGLKNWKLLVGKIKGHRFFVVCLCLMTLFAITNQVSIGPINVSVYIPSEILKYAELLRSPARMFWPMFYGLVFLVLYLNIHYYSGRVLVLILLGALLLQIVDLTPGLKKIHSQFGLEKVTQMKTNLNNSFWNEAALKYKKIIEVQPAMSWDYQNIAGFAINHGLATNAIYLARNDPSKLELAKQKWASEVFDSKLRSDTLYVIDDRLLPLVKTRNTFQSNLLSRVDGRNVLAPNWFSSHQDRLSHFESFQSMPILAHLNKPIFFNQTSSGKDFLAYGWADPESWGVWSDSKHAKIIVPIKPADAQLVRGVGLELNAFIDSKNPHQDVKIRVNNSDAQSFKLTKSEGNQVNIAVEQGAVNSGFIELDLYFPNARRPLIDNFDSDRRLLAIGLVAARLK